MHSFPNIVYANNASHRCFYCNQHIEDDALLYATVDHLWPDSLYGSNRPCNLVAACHSCNAKRGSKIPDEYLLTVEECEDIKKGTRLPPDWMNKDPFDNLFIKKGPDRELYKRRLFCLVNSVVATHATDRRDAIDALRGGLLSVPPYDAILNE